MELEKLWKSATVEADWLRYYGHSETRLSEKFEDEKFYDRIISIGYTKKVIPLVSRCAMCYITSDKPVMESDIKDLRIISGPRNHENNVYTPLEYLIGKKVGTDQLTSIIKPK
jgi:hypothetical protein